MKTKNIVDADNYARQLVGYKTASAEAQAVYNCAIVEAVQVLVAAEYGKAQNKRRKKETIIAEVAEITGYKSRNIYLIIAGGGKK